ncbi:MAG: thioredoxin domain-containing protein [Limibacillus sp.]
MTPAQAQTANAALVSDTDRVLGDPEAPVTILEYSSLTCPHCASFHTQTLPQVKEEWIDTGKAKLVYRHFPLDRLALYAAMTASCLPTDRAYFAFLDVLRPGLGKKSSRLASRTKISRIPSCNSAWTAHRLLTFRQRRPS